MRKLAIIVEVIPEAKDKSIEDIIKEIKTELDKRIYPTIPYCKRVLDVVESKP